ncbi:MAG: ATP-binding protein [Knoellia sp.]
MTSTDTGADKAPKSDAKSPAKAKAETPLDEFGGAIGKGQVRTIRAPWGPSTVTRVRKAVVADLRARNLAEQTIDESEIVVSELMTNAIRHARPLADGCLRVRWKVRGEVVEIEVTDGGGDSVPVPAPAAVWVSSGRGLRIIRSLAHEWGVGEDKGAQTVWAAMGGPSRRRAT